MTTPLSKRSKHEDDRDNEADLPPNERTYADDQYVVLDLAFVSHVDKDRKVARQFNRGEVITVVDEVHDIDRLLALGVLAPANEVATGGAVPLTALQKSQAAARYHQQNSPVLDLAVQPIPEAPMADPIAAAQ